MGRIFGSLSAIFFAMMYNLIAFFIYFVFLVGVFFVPSIHNSFDFFVTQNFSLAVLSLLAAVIIIIIAIRRFFLTAGNIEDAYASGRFAGLALYGGIIIFNISLGYVILMMITLMRHISIVVH